MKSALRKITVCTIAVMATACGQSLTNTETTSSVSSLSQVDLQTKSLVSFKLTDAPNRELKSVVVDIDHMEVVIAGAGKAGRLILAKGLGPVDLLTLQNGVTLPLQDVVVPEGLQIQQIRLVLREEGHYAVKSDDSICELKTPSAQKTGVKIILTNKVQFEAGHQYNIVVDFDALESVVIQGNGGCLLKPVLKLKSAFKTPIVIDSDSSSDAGADEANDDAAADSSSDSSGDSSSADSEASDEADVSTGVIADEGTETQSESEVSTAGDVVEGEELVVAPEQNDSGNDGWDYTPIIDGESFPVLSEEELSQLL